ncbi:NADP-dependent phosphogluconate dehydrogenase [Candidatus Liberibacter americanus]|uniref:6-phosphogluconate dehydrogenase, decarboxylating n=1 Tax=Candidatus Liberibacter americanus str. Sao Paulo TaxID=1261131 RepID=U6B3H2_9HYPH|nr:NADP-dependent phosphogluconate dehydrogenase [Candidatus Liberibacter americanus]AHA27609.1 6-phosphogluconate dehydrogenase, family 1 [Candidatus Liberibacter americanus str. Sao Paulo]EMS36317.1 6-phosphogluconate dehydrogenase [Candidatus Liberibacter americanus PW_SP]
MKKADIGVIGLGTMGSSLALNMLEKNFRLAVYNNEPELTDVFFKKTRDLSKKVIKTKTLQQMVEAISIPRKIFMMITDGKPIDLLIEKLEPMLSAEDILMDGGNSNFHDTQIRSIKLNKKKIRFFGIGVSGGSNGARYGASLMIGGNEKAYRNIENILQSISANYQGQPCYALLGPDGSGHFTKTIHNGIEYANMQIIADVYGILRDGFHKTSLEISKYYLKWNEGKLNSYLMKITAEILLSIDPITEFSMLDIISDKAYQKGTGQRSVIEGHKLFAPMTITEAAVFYRNLSERKNEREKMQSIFIDNSSFSFNNSDLLIEDLENAIYAAQIIAYTQGFLVMKKASQKYNWNLQLATIARIWREGCIIKSQLINEIAEALTLNYNNTNLLTIPNISNKIIKSLPSLRRIVIACTKHGYPIPALIAALSFFDTYTQGQGTANLVQAQRDFFGSHGFDRSDGIKEKNAPWRIS